MKIEKPSTFLFVLLSGLLTATGLINGATPAVDDPYASLKLYNGKWDTTTAIGGTEKARLENHCAQTGLFYVCEQNVDGKTMGMVIFQPVAKLPGGGHSYKSTGLSAEAGSAPGWNKLTIQGDRWLYSWEDTEAGKKVLWRNVNQFSGTDKIHFEIQRSDDGNTWKTVKGGDEIRTH